MLNSNRLLEDNFILNSAKLNLSEKNKSTLKKISECGINWNLLFEKAQNHSVSTLIYYSLKNSNLLNIIPEYVYKKFQETYYRTAVSNAYAIRATDEIAGIINEKIVLLKGADLIQNLYPDIAIRSMCDIDILVKKENSELIWNKLLNHGFQINKQITTSVKSSIHKKYSKTVENHHPQIFNKKFKVEIHYNLFNEEKYEPITKSAYINSIKISKNIYILSNEIKLIFLCHHFCRHLKRNAILRMLCDINELISKYGNEIKWNEIEIITSNTKLRDDLMTALNFANLMLETPLPSNYIDKKLQESLDMGLNFYFKLKEKDETGFHIYSTKLNSFINLADKAKYILRTIIPSKIWITDRFKTSGRNNVILLYFKYWAYLFRRYVMKKNIIIGNQN